MTFSIAALCPRTGQIGIAATTAAQSVGKLACHALPGVGAFASQARLNPYLAYDGLRLLQRGATAEVALARVLASDPEQQELAERLVLALRAGADAGGDVEGERSINVMVFADEEYPLCDIRIDDHDEPLIELERLFALYREEILPVVLGLPKRTEIAEPR